MEVKRALRIESLRGQIDRSEYQVDVHKVAQAILGRPTAHLWLAPAPAPVRVLESEDHDGTVLPSPPA